MRVTKNSRPRRQVAALPVRAGEAGREVLLVTSRETRRWVVPKGWPMKGFADPDAAAREAEEEAGLVGSIARKPLGSYLYFKRLKGHFELLEVDVYPLQVTGRLETWREKGQREQRWFAPSVAAELVMEPGLADLIRGLS